MSHGVPLGCIANPYSRLSLDMVSQCVAVVISSWFDLLDVCVCDCTSSGVMTHASTSTLTGKDAAEYQGLIAPSPVVTAVWTPSPKREPKSAFRLSTPTHSACWAMLLCMHLTIFTAHSGSCAGAVGGKPCWTLGRCMPAHGNIAKRKRKALSERWRKRVREDRANAALIFDIRLSGNPTAPRYF